MGKTELVVKENGLAAAFKRAKEVGERRVKVGVLADGPGGAKHEGSGLTIAEIAAVLEFGTEDGHIPPRPALRNTFDAQREKLAAMGQKLIHKVIVDGSIGIEQALGILGSTLAADVKKAITMGEGIKPGNAASTIKAKGSSRPWVDTGRVVGAITYAVIPASGDKEESSEGESK